ncbi:MAG: dihydrofolate reductase [Nanoarchaeota archaeon]
MKQHALALIVAMRRDHLIGCDNKIPWKISEEQKLFREVTIGSVVIMGRETWCSIPQKFRPLPDRENIVVSSTLVDAPGAYLVSSIDAALSLAHKLNKNIFVIGGVRMYKVALEFVDMMHVSWVEYDGGCVGQPVYFPEFDHVEWILLSSKKYEYFTYEIFQRRNHSKEGSSRLFQNP